MLELEDFHKSSNRLIALLRFAIPAFNTGQAIFLAIVIIFCAVIALQVDTIMAAYIFVGGYVSMILSVLLLGIYPVQRQVKAEDVNYVVSFLNSADNLSRIGNNLWAPKGYESWLWSSDRISVEPAGDQSLFVLAGRARDIELIISELARRRST